ncbi:MAG: kelch repeat-containing protein [Planctomycetota bacterium]
MTTLLKLAALTSLAATASAQSFSWTLATPATLPSARERAASGTDGVSYYMYGGQNGTNVTGLDELWSFDGTNWTLLTGTGTGPGTRTGATAGYDLARGKLVVFGGLESFTTSVRLNDTWEWDATNGWVNVTPAAGSPDGRWLTNNGVYVPGFGLVFHGGNAADASGTTYKSNETWAWVGGAWVLLASSGPAVQNAMMEYRTMQDDLILHGGVTENPTTGANEFNGDTWRYDFATGTWAQLTTGGTTPFNSANATQGLFASMSYYNPLTSNVIVHGGNGGSSSTTTWQFDGTDWTEITTNGVGCRNGGMHWISALNAAVYGPCNETNGARNRTRTHGPQTLAMVSSYGSGCSGLAGTTLTLAADNDPWVGVTFGATCTNMSAAAPIKLAVWGLGTAATPITGVLGAGPGCTLLNTAGTIQATVAAATSFTVSLAIPADPALTGFQLNLQAAELDVAPGNLATSNGITLTIGG